VILVDADDRHHGECARALEAIREPLGTDWPAVTEAMYLVADIPEGQARIWQMLERGAVRLVPFGDEDIPAIRQLMAKYADPPMDLADAALVRVADRDGVRTVFTLDRRDFGI
jgi:predicted nucleic acid-binding protein